MAKKQCTAEDGVFQKILYYDYTRLRRISSYPPFQLMLPTAMTVSIMFF
jgi:hypothetical protein